MHRFLMSVTRMKPLVILGLLSVLGACTDGRDLDRAPPDLGDFTLGHNIVIAPNLTTLGALSREATAEEWTTALTKAIDDRFGRYPETEDTKFYHFGVSVEGYILARVGVPLVLQPNSVVIFRITVWDDALQAKMNTEPEEITVLEAVSPEMIAGSGLTQTREEQLENLAILGAKQIEQFLIQQKREANWFRGFVPEGAVIPVAEAGETNAAGRSQGELEGIVEDANRAVQASEGGGAATAPVPDTAATTLP